MLSSRYNTIAKERKRLGGRLRANNRAFSNDVMSAILPSLHDVKFIFDSVRLGFSSPANILQIADVALRVVFLLFLLCF